MAGGASPSPTGNRRLLFMVNSTFFRLKPTILCHSEAKPKNLAGANANLNTGVTQSRGEHRSPRIKSAKNYPLCHSEATPKNLAGAKANLNTGVTQRRGDHRSPA